LKRIAKIILHNRSETFSGELKKECCPKKKSAFFQRAGAGERLGPWLAFLPTDEPANLSVRPFISSCSSIRAGFPSKTPWISDIVLSRLLLLLLGLVIVVPKLACLVCPFLDPDPEGEFGLMEEG
jgi:hypothetical protein